MRRDRTRATLVWLLGAACIALAWVIYREAIDLSEDKVVDAAHAALPNAPAVVPAQPAVAMPDQASLAVILERPVFSETRRPSGTTPGGGQAPSIDFSLSGVVISGSQRSALVRAGKGEVVQRLTEGEDIDGWKLIEIASDRIVVRRGTVEADVFLDYSAPAPPIPRSEKPKEKPAAQPLPQKPAEETAAPPGGEPGEPEDGAQN